ncbi:MAG: hypothetical protein K0S53_2697 [Bacteroidetes bacterium]|jgi:hypothetical protein|nr:hypothetical protein [Bacteroidota bacterium]
MLKPIELNNITEEHILGNWRVQSKILNRSDPESPFATAEEHHFLKDSIYKTLNGEDLLGKWVLFLETDIIKSPLLKFTLKNQAVNTIITLLLYTDDKEHAQLTIYFDTGLELVLLKN